MPLAHTGDLLREAAQNGTGLGAFNVVSLELGEAIVEAAEQAQLPAVLQVSENCIRFHRGNLVPLVTGLGALASTSSVRVSLHLDHIEDEELLRQAAGTSVTSAMFDASKLPFEANVAASRAIGQWAHGQGWHVEAELGEVGGKDGAHAPGARTDPFDAERFVAEAGVDSLAIAIGSSHAMTSRTAHLDHELLARIHAAVPVPLVLHGSSGVPDEELRSAIAGGITKVNVGTIVNVAFTRAVRESLADPGLVDPRKYLAPARGEVTALVRDMLELISIPKAAAL
ncbi:class II fructose-bisphosphate aldolase [Arthrobacter sp. NyZ413]|uniref:class II fructose-bisphosphate aldolase n=1 Tax=Arthrobacter sp. NyZ413 TaxID=3144669 RepID=UPI003BF866EE